MSKHTPGPWKLSGHRTGDSYLWIVEADQRISVHAESAESEANARLIASAPELLKEIEALRADAERYRWMKQEVKRIPPAWELIGWDAAIDAARSKT